MDLLTMAEITWAIISQIPNKGIKKPSKIMTDGKRVNAYSGVDKSSRKKEFGRRKWGEVTIKDSKIIL